MSVNSVFEIPGRVVIVTGGGTGIGRAIAAELARAGADVAICSRNHEHLEAVAPEIRSLGHRCLAIPTDVRQPDQVRNVIQKTLDEFGRIDALVNNAGANFYASVQDMSFNAWNTIVSINLTGTFLCCQAVFETMSKQGKGSIVNISSTAGRDGHPQAPHYGAAKAGVINLTRSLASEWGKLGIRVNCVAPGPIVTEGSRWYQASRSREREQPQANRGMFARGLCRPGQPNEVAYAVLFLVSDAASYVNGVELDLDGGL